MLNITYAPVDEDFAKQLQQDLTQSSVRLEKPMLVVLVSPEAMQDSTILEAIKKAQANDHNIAPLILRETPLPKTLEDYEALDCTKGYKRERTAQFIKRIDIGARIRKSNRRILFFMALIVGIIFVVSVWTIGTGQIRPPMNEFETEDAVRQQMIQDFVIPTLEGVLPRTTEDAVNFPATVQAQPTRNRIYLAQTATALPTARQATLDYQATAADMTITAQAAE